MDQVVGVLYISMEKKLDERFQAVYLRMNGYSFKKIAKLLDVSPGSVHLWCRNIELTEEQKENNRRRSASSRVRECKICNIEFSIYPLVNGKKRRLQTRSTCFNCRPFVEPEKISLLTNSERVSRARRRIKQKAIEYKGGKCKLCGYDKCNAALHFHHLDPSKKDFRISHKSYHGWYKVKKELDKCVLLCANCHAEVHANYNPG